MKMRVLFAVLIVALVCTGTASAGKIGFVDVERVVAQVEDAQSDIKNLETWEESARQELGVLSARYADLKERAAKQAAVATAESVALLQAEEMALRREIEDKRLKFDRQMSAKTEEYLKKVGSKVGTVASDYGKANGFDAIFILKGQPMIFVADQADLTDITIRLYNERFPAK